HKKRDEYIVQREVLDQVRLDEVAEKGNWTTKPSLSERVKESLRCSVSKLKRTVVSWVPVLGWLPQYQFKENFAGDFISGCSVASMHLPQGMAYAPLAALPPVFGLYTSFFPVLIFVIFTTSKHISIGTFSVVSMMAGTVTQRLAPDQNFIVNGTNGSKVDTEARDAARVQIACALALLTGIFQILLGLVRFGFVVNYLSQPLIRAYTTASACQVACTQLKFLFGVSPALYSGPLSFVYTVVDVCRLLYKTRLVELIASLISLFVLIVIKQVNFRFKEKLFVPIPIELILVILGTIITHYGGLIGKFGISVVGKIPSGFRAPFVPNASYFPSIVGDAFSLAIVSYTINIALSKTFAFKYGYRVDNNQELVAVGLSNTIGSFFYCYNVSSSMSRSLVQETTGCKTQVTGIISSVFMLIIIVKVGSLFEELPKAILSSIVFVNLTLMFMQLADVYTLWKTSKTDLLVWLVTFICTILLNLDIGLAAAVGFSLLTFIFRSQLPRYYILGLVPGTDLYLDIETYREAKEIPGIKIFRSSATMYHISSEMYLDALEKKTGFDLETLLMAKRKREAAQKRKEEKELKKATQGNQEQNKLRRLLNGRFFFKKSRMSEEEFPEGQTSTKGPDMGEVNWGYQRDTSMFKLDSVTSFQSVDSIKKFPQIDEEEKGRFSGSDTHSIILDMTTTSFVDVATVNTLKKIFRDFEELHLDVYLAGCQACVVKQLETIGFFSDTIPKSRLFVTIHDAVLFILKKHRQTEFNLVS
uniref:Solute carrier family 26 member 6, like 2 n=1 Tax=Mastacembelus armatus TaxID=205130 RepID=A0A3Q3M141_9TELE